MIAAVFNISPGALLSRCLPSTPDFFDASTPQFTWARVRPCPTWIDAILPIKMWKLLHITRTGFIFFSIEKPGPLPLMLGYVTS